MMVKDEWVLAAMTDDTVVVELLVRLKKQQRLHVAKSALVEASLRWGVRQPRSRSLRCDAVSTRRKDASDSATNSMRASPTTPLSWSGGDSAATADDEPGRHHTSAARSKGIASNETNSNAIKRSRKKKSFSELKDEEGLLLKERTHLNKELEILRASYKLQSARNENLKRIKLDLGLDSGKSSTGTQVLRGWASSSFPSHSTMIDLPLSGSCEAAHETVPSSNSLCFLPDLNMMPTDDDSASETLCGIS